MVGSYTMPANGRWDLIRRLKVKAKSSCCTAVYVTESTQYAGYGETFTI